VPLAFFFIGVTPVSSHINAKDLLALGLLVEGHSTLLPRHQLGCRCRLRLPALGVPPGSEIGGGIGAEDLWLLRMSLILSSSAGGRATVTAKTNSTN
jgi:hypothetical protein